MQSIPSSRAMEEDVTLLTICMPIIVGVIFTPAFIIAYRKDRIDTDWTDRYQMDEWAEDIRLWQKGLSG